MNPRLSVAAAAAAALLAAVLQCLLPPVGVALGGGVLDRAGPAAARCHITDGRDNRAACVAPTAVAGVLSQSMLDHGRTRHGVRMPPITSDGLVTLASYGCSACPPIARRIL